jgi:hypothetical protein
MSKEHLDFPGDEKRGFNDLLERFKKAQIELYPVKAENSPQELKEKFPGKKILTCDFYLDGAEHGQRITGGFIVDEIISIDHHPPVPEMAQAISSTNLAIQYVQEFGPIGNDWLTVINHTDCDSVLSMLIMKGILPPEDRFGQAAIASDHTGEENQIADLLLALEGFRDLDMSIRNLQNLLQDKPLEEEAIQKLKNRYAERQRAKEEVEKGKFTMVDGIAYAELAEKVDSGFLPPLLPEAEIILTASGHPSNPGHKEIKLRLGLKAPKGKRLDTNAIKKIITGYGGRWNTGSNRRSPGIDASIKAKDLVDQLVLKKNEVLVSSDN